jgi:hypothetical protein
MSGNPWDKWFWSDWECDPAVQQCSLAAQGLWMRMLCIAAKSTPKGYMRVGKNSLSDVEIAGAVGRPLEEILPLIAELEKWRVFSRDRKGTIYNRRMINEAKRSKTNAKNGKKGGDVSHGNKRGIFKSLGNDPERQTERHVERPPEPHKPEAISHKPEAKAKAKASLEIDGKALGELGDRCLQAFRLPKNQFMGHYGPLRSLLDAGATPDEIVKIAERIAGRDGFTLRGNPIALLQKAGRDELEKLRRETGAAAEPDGPELSADEIWRRRIRRWLSGGVWSSMWGPAPDQPDTDVPDHVLAECGLKRAGR